MNKAAQAGERGIVRNADFPDKARNWLSPGNHNFLRISRILRSLSLLGLEAEARAFWAALEAVHDDRAR